MPTSYLNKAVKDTKVAVNILKTTPNDFNVLTLLRIFSYNPMNKLKEFNLHIHHPDFRPTALRFLSVSSTALATASTVDTD